MTANNGRYRIDDLRPGTYRVRFSLQGWQPREIFGIELSGSLTVTIDATLALDQLMSDVNVFARAIDVQGTHRETSLSGDIINRLPTARTYNGLLVLVPGILTSTNDTVMGKKRRPRPFRFYGGRANEGRVLLDNLTVGSPPSGNSGPTYAFDTATRRGGHIHDHQCPWGN